MLNKNLLKVLYNNKHSKVNIKLWRKRLIKEEDLAIVPGSNLYMKHHKIWLYLNLRTRKIIEQLKKMKSVTSQMKMMKSLNLCYLY